VSSFLLLTTFYELILSAPFTVHSPSHQIPKDGHMDCLKCWVLLTVCCEHLGHICAHTQLAFQEEQLLSIYKLEGQCQSALHSGSYPTQLTQFQPLPMLSTCHTQYRGKSPSKVFHLVWLPNVTTQYSSQEVDSHLPGDCFCLFWQDCFPSVAGVK
jgi:hypothetical protein